MVAEDAWRVVAHDREDLPALLLRASFNKEGYQIFLSDLSHIWTEVLSKEDLIDRAQQLECTIDPRDDSQYDIFTTKLKSALQQKSGTSLELNSARTGTTITLSLAVTLPKPLSALEWEIHLQRDDAALYTQLTGPLIKHASTLQRQVEYLISELHAKDHVLSRLTDRLEASGQPLSDVFPNVVSLGSRARAPTKEKLAQHVRGLATFDDKHWMDRISTPADDALDHVPDIFSKLTKPEKLSIRKPNWWGGLHVKVGRPMTLSAESEPSEHGEEADEGDTTVVFETQLHNFTEKPAEKDDSSTDDEFDSNIASSPVTGQPERVQDQEVAERPKKKIGTIGGRAKPRSPSPPSRQPPPERSSTSSKSPTVDEALPPKPKSKLGTIGGKKAPAAKTPEPESNTETQQSPPPSLPKSRKLGTIGGRKKDDNVKTAVEDKARDIAIKQEAASSQVAPMSSAVDEDIPEERSADHKRDQLKRMLEEQAKAPVKKKRRF